MTGTPPSERTIVLRSGIRVVLVDGRSGSGKTELATALAAGTGAQLVRLDDLYPGWDGLDEASAIVPGILRGERWRSWDWAVGRAGDEHALDPDRPTIVEGVGAISRASRPLADVAIWVDLDLPLRRRRALDRDGDTYAPHWDRWARQEARFIAREHPRALADLRVHGGDSGTALAAVVRLVT